MGERQRFDVVALVIGVALVVLALTWLAAGDDAYVDAVRWVAPGALIATGVGVLVGRRD